MSDTESEQQMFIIPVAAIENQIPSNPFCHGMQELPTAAEQRARVFEYLYTKNSATTGDPGPRHPHIVSERQTALESLTLTCADASNSSERCDSSAGFPDLSLPHSPHSPLFTHLAHGLALTVGSALGSTPPSAQTCLTAFQVPNSASLTAGARAWSKHAHRSHPPPPLSDSDEQKAKEKEKRMRSAGWWGTPSGPVATINEKALALFWKLMDSATWRNLHWLPHQVLVYEVRVAKGYGMRWSEWPGGW